jgi:hypothetical protein
MSKWLDNNYIAEFLKIITKGPNANKRTLIVCEIAIFLII